MKNIPEVGDIVTISRNKITGDRSFTDSFFKVLGTNDLHVRLKFLNNDRCNFGTILLLLDEHDFSLANHLW
jgi:hypothetical protein